MSLKIDQNKAEIPLSSIDKKGRDTDFLNAVKKDDVKLAALLIASGANINATDKQGMTALAHVITQSDLNQEMVTLLLKHKADIHQKTEDGDSALRLACDWGDPRRVGLLLNVSLERAKKYMGSMKQRILLAHVNSLKGDFEGNVVGDSAAFVMKAFESMPAELSLLHSSERDQLIAAGKVTFQQDAKLTVSSIREGKLTFVACGNSDHTIYLVFANGYMAICNRSNPPCTINAYKIKPKAFTENTYALILAQLDEEEDATGNGFYVKLLPYLLSPDSNGRVKDAICKKLERISPKTVKAGVCSYTSAKTALRAAAAMMRIHPDRAELSWKDLTIAKQFAKNFSAHARLVALDDFVMAGIDPDLDAELLKTSIKMAGKHAENNPFFLNDEYQKQFKYTKIVKKS